MIDFSSLTIPALWQVITPEQVHRPARGRVIRPAAAALAAARDARASFVVGHPLREIVEQALPFHGNTEWAAADRFFVWAATMKRPEIMTFAGANGSVERYWPRLDTQDAITALGRCATLAGRQALDSAIDTYAELTTTVSERIEAVRRDAVELSAEVDAIAARDSDLCIALSIATYLGYRARQVEEMMTNAELFWERRALREESGQILPPVLTDEQSARHIAHLIADRADAVRTWSDMLEEFSPYLELTPECNIVTLITDVFARRGGEPYWNEMRADAIRAFGETLTLGDLARFPQDSHRRRN